VNNKIEKVIEKEIIYYRRRNNFYLTFTWLLRLYILLLRLYLYKLQSDVCHFFGVMMLSPGLRW